MIAVSFKSLMKTGRAVKVYSRKTHGRNHELIYVSVHLAGMGNDDGSARLISVGFKERKDADNAARSIVAVLRDGMAEGWIASDSDYNRVLQLWGDTAHRKIGRTNAQLLENAELTARDADQMDVMMDVRGMTLKEYLVGILRKMGLGKLGLEDKKAEQKGEADNDGNG